MPIPVIVVPISAAFLLAIFSLTIGAARRSKDKEERKKAEEERKQAIKRARTNLELPELVTEKIKKKLTAELYVPHAEVVNLYDYLYSLTIKHNVPFKSPNVATPFASELSDNEFERHSKTCFKEEENGVRRLLEEANDQQTNLPTEIIQCCKTAETTFEYIRKNYTIEERIQGVPYFNTKRGKQIEKDAGEITDKKLFELKQAAFQNQNAFQCYDNLLTFMVQRELSALGYSYSHNGKGSQFEEDAKNKIENCKNTIKYPWLHDDASVKRAEEELKRLESEAMADRVQKREDVKNYKISIGYVEKDGKKWVAETNALEEASLIAQRELEIDKIHRSLSMGERRRLVCRVFISERPALNKKYESDRKHITVLTIISIVLGILGVASFVTMMIIDGCDFDSSVKWTIAISAIVAMSLSIIWFMLFWVTNGFTWYCKPMLRKLQKAYYYYPSLESENAKEYSVLLERISKKKK